ncbi:MAG: hypothetical protein CXR30_19185 [Geobacter sp.]|nr:MAG: hypothetical protein CXR30_19185 [Geobacter sp.]
MKRILTALLLMAIPLSITSVASAQGDEQQAPEKSLAEKVKSNAANEKMMPEPDVQLARLTKGLKLTEEQQEQIKPILEDEYAKLNEFRYDDELSPKKISKKVEELRTDTIAKINKFLSPEQQKNYALVNKEIKTYKKQRIKQNRKDRIGIKSDQPTE